jgi:SET domain-containing protein
VFLFKRSKEIIATLSVDIQLGSSTIHGIGVFCKKKFRKGEIVETAPFIKGTARDYAILNHTTLHDYYFVLDDKETPVVIGLGFASWYNHSCPANAKYKISKKNNTIQIIACRDIISGSEITINYHGDPDDDSPIQFTSKS